MQISYHPMQIADYQAIFSLWQQTEGMGLGLSDSQPNIAAFLQRNPQLSWVARDSETVIGAILCGHDGRRGYLHHLAVAQKYRNQGIARELVQRCLTTLTALGIAKCNIVVFRENTSGQQFWEHISWQERKDLLIMQTTLCAEDR